MNSDELPSQVRRRLAPDPGSFRDPSGRIYLVNGRVFRTVTEVAVADYKFTAASGLIAKLEGDERLVPSKEVAADDLGEGAAGAALVLEHPRLPLVTYPYEWSFEMLKAAALAHLDVHLEALNYGVSLSDASAYNMQFIGARPVFIDRLSFRRYREGEFWTGHRQFCEQFLYPLLLKSFFGIPHNAWFRGAPEGIPTEDFARLVPWRHKLSWKVLTHVVLPAALQTKASRQEVSRVLASPRRHGLPSRTFRRMLEQLRGWIDALAPRAGRTTLWADYVRTHSYASSEQAAKIELVRKFVGAINPPCVWDIGCNTGDYSQVALEAGAGYVIGFDADQQALDLAYKRARHARLNFTPLYLDAANPTPNQGWAERERHGLRARGGADSVLALALVHHLIIGRNIPMADVLEWITALAPRGIIEFVPKSDPMVQDMLRLREDIFHDYTESAFLGHLQTTSNVVSKHVVSGSGRCLFEFSRPP